MVHLYFNTDGLQTRDPFLNIVLCKKTKEEAFQIVLKKLKKNQEREKNIGTDGDKPRRHKLNGYIDDEKN